MTTKTKKITKISHCLHSKRSQHRSLLQTPEKKKVLHSNTNVSPFGILHERLIVDKDIVNDNLKEILGSLSDSESNNDVLSKRKSVYIYQKDQ